MIGSTPANVPRRHECVCVCKLTRTDGDAVRSSTKPLPIIVDARGEVADQEIQQEVGEALQILLKDVYNEQGQKTKIQVRLVSSRDGIELAIIARWLADRREDARQKGQAAHVSAFDMSFPHLTGRHRVRSALSGTSRPHKDISP